MNTTTFLIFVGDQCGKSEEAINFYTSIGCSKDGDTPTQEPSELNYDFASDIQGWQGNFTDYPEGEETFMSLTLNIVCSRLHLMKPKVNEAIR